MLIVGELRTAFNLNSICGDHSVFEDSLFRKLQSIAGNQFRQCLHVATDSFRHGWNSRKAPVRPKGLDVLLGKPKRQNFRLAVWFRIIFESMLWDGHTPSTA